MDQNAALQQRVAAAAVNGVALLAALREKLSTLALAGEAITIPEFGAARFSLEYDKYNGEQTLMASFTSLRTTGQAYCCSIQTAVALPNTM